MKKILVIVGFIVVIILSAFLEQKGYVRSILFSLNIIDLAVWLIVILLFSKLERKNNRSA